LLLPLSHISTLVMFRQIYRQPYVTTAVHIRSKLWTRFIGDIRNTQQGS